ncbi:Alpha/Beta hydrolase protein [Syncephalastrum racemosum]|uniref:Alpha/Beta hydrolase protein n=1 Tax=Syncephalastrum racemosum TaxID=13706 RepID=A0A1X2H4C9_SYNRA|nr:Alpha/Beta hydrolase protein [Syncephalastrum racemosum]
MSSREPQLHPTYAECERTGPRLPFDTMSLTEIRALSTKMFKETIAKLSLPPMHKEELFIDSHGRSIELIITRPPGTENTELPVLLFLHGGGFVLCDKFSHHTIVNDIVEKSNVAVVFVEYSLAPEHPFPAGLEDCYTAFHWIIEHGKEHHLDPSRIAVGGDSAGGNFTAALSLKLKDAGEEKLMKSQILIYPATMLAKEHFESYDLFGHLTVSLDSLQFFNRNYLPGPVQEVDDKYALPGLATDDDLKGLPPALVITAESDILRDEGEAYAHRLNAAGVETSMVRILGAPHGYISMSFNTPQYRHSLALITAFLHETLKQ